MVSSEVQRGEKSNGENGAPTNFNLIASAPFNACTMYTLLTPNR